jgi:uncharacterized membrane protein YsdA (DUF1294 family)
VSRAPARAAINVFQNWFSELRELVPVPDPAAASMALAGLFHAFLAASVRVGRLPSAVAGFYLVASAATFVAYGLDKSAARSGGWRTAERTLHLLGLAGGWPGALVAQQALRHKSAKGSFRRAFWATVVANCCLLGWLFTGDGSAALASLLASP